MTFPKLEMRLLGLGGKDSIPYKLRRSGRHKSVGIFVEPTGDLSVLAPTQARLERIEQILRRRLKWIRRKQREVEALPPRTPPREWIAGETHRYLGRQYRLKLDKNPNESIKLLGSHFVVSLRDGTDTERTRQLMEGWYREHAKTLLKDRVDRLLASTTWLNVEPPRIQVRVLQQRWGSTTNSGCVSFNIDLIKLPMSCIDYVVAHELVHLAIPNHSSAFWRMLERVLPDWKRWRAKLESIEV